MVSHQKPAQKTETVVIKIGTAALQKRDGILDEDLLGNLVSEMSDLKRNGHRVILVTSGAIGMGKTAEIDLGLLEGKVSDPETVGKQIQASIGQPSLMNVYSGLFLRHGIYAAQVLTEKAHFTDNGNGGENHGTGPTGAALLRMDKLNPNIVNYFKGVLLLPNVVPIVNENDTAAIAELGPMDNDQIAGLVAVMVEADRCIFLSSGAGVCRTGEDLSEKQVIRVVDFDDPSTLPEKTDGQSASGRGGMDRKLQIAEELTKTINEITGEPIKVYIAPSREPGVIGKIMRGEPVGTELLSGKKASRPTEPKAKKNFPALVA